MILLEDFDFIAQGLFADEAADLLNAATDRFEEGDAMRGDAPIRMMELLARHEPEHLYWGCEFESMAEEKMAEIATRHINHYLLHG